MEYKWDVIYSSGFHIPSYANIPHIQKINLDQLTMDPSNDLHDVATKTNKQQTKPEMHTISI